MIEIRHEKLNIEKPYRCIVVSDIHSHLDRFKQLLKETRYTTQDYLIIDGDFVDVIKPSIGAGGRRYYYDDDIEVLLKIKKYLLVNF